MAHANRPRVLKDMSQQESELERLRRELEEARAKLAARQSGEAIFSVIDYTPKKGKNAGKTSKYGQISGGGVYPILISAKQAALYVQFADDIKAFADSNEA